MRIWVRKIKSSLDKKYSHLLIALLINFIFSTFVTGTITSIILSLFFLLTMITIVETFAIKLKLFKLYTLIAFFAFSLQVINELGLIEYADTVYLVIVYSIHIIYLAAGVYLIFKDILTSKKVTLDTILGSICIYFLIGILWALIYGICSTIDNNAFSESLTEQRGVRTLIYFSFTTLTTVGYGDISPVSHLTRMLTNLEAIIGQMYPAIIISILVSIYTSERTKS